MYISSVKLYLISGLAADYRIFKNLIFPPGIVLIYLGWISPEQNETLKNYSLRLAEKIDTKEKFALMGLSMGGMIAVEIAKKFPPDRLILLSSIPIHSHLPFYFVLAKKINLHKILPVSVLRYGSILKRMFTAESAEDKEILKMIIKESDPKFVKWAMHAILHWDNIEPPQNYIHIHGSRDEMLPMKFTKPTHVIPKAGHLMVLNRAVEINEVLRKIFTS